MTAVDDLYSALGRLPRLAGAMCRGRHTLFDDTDLPDEALQLCRRCPVLADCERWLDSLNADQRPYGVIAGTVRPWPGERKKRKGRKAS